MATITPVYNPSSAPQWKNVLSGTFTGPASYATGGEAVDHSGDFSITNEPISGHCIGAGAGTPAYGVNGVWDAANGKYVLYNASTGDEVANGTDLSGVTFHCFGVLAL